MKREAGRFISGHRPLVARWASTPGARGRASECASTAREWRDRHWTSHLFEATSRAILQGPSHAVRSASGGRKGERDLRGFAVWGDGAPARVRAERVYVSQCAAAAPGPPARRPLPPPSPATKLPPLPSISSKLSGEGRGWGRGGGWFFILKVP